jgi:hypothetical protein
MLIVVILLVSRKILIIALPDASRYYLYESSYLGYPAPPIASLYSRSFVVTNVNGPLIGSLLVVAAGVFVYSGTGFLENSVNFISS